MNPPQLSPKAQSRPPPRRPRQPPAEEPASSSKLTLVLGGVAALVTLGGIFLLVSELTKPTKKKRKKKAAPAKPTPTSVHPARAAPAPLARPPGDYLTLEMNTEGDRSPKKIQLCQGENDKPGAYVAANKQNAQLTIPAGSLLFEVEGTRVEGKKYQSAHTVLYNSCKKKNGTIVFLRNPELNKKWSKAEKVKNEGNALFGKGEIDNSIVKYTEATVLHPTNRVYYSNKVLALLQKAKKLTDKKEKTALFQHALSDCRKMRELDVFDNHHKGHHVRGVTLLEMEKYELARNAFQTVLTIDANNQTAKDRLKDCELGIERTKAAEEKAAAEAKAKQEAAAPAKAAADAAAMNGKEVDPVVEKVCGEMVEQAIKDGVNKTVMETTPVVGNGK